MLKKAFDIGINGECIDKVWGYADDIVFIIKECNRSIKKLFKTYHSFSKISGIEINTAKTHPFTPNSGFTRVLRFLPTIPLLGEGIPPMTWR